MSDSTDALVERLARYVAETTDAQGAIHAHGRDCQAAIERIEAWRDRPTLSAALHDCRKDRDALLASCVDYRAQIEALTTERDRLEGGLKPFDCDISTLCELVERQAPDATEAALQAGWGHHYRLETGLGRAKAARDYHAVVAALVSGERS